YAYEESILTLSNRLLERSLFVSVKQAAELRQRGWRAKGSTCEACGRRVWGPGVQGNIYEAWEERQEQVQQRRAERKALLGGAVADRGKGKAYGADGVEEHSGSKGKGKQTDIIARQDFAPATEDDPNGQEVKGAEDEAAHAGNGP